jgi:hypothetical protein
MIQDNMFLLISIGIVSFGIGGGIVCYLASPPRSRIHVVQNSLMNRNAIIEIANES